MHGGGSAARAVAALALVVATVAGSPPVERPAPADGRAVSAPPVAPAAVPAVPAVPATPAVAVRGWVGATPMAAARPERVLIPAIGVDSELMDLGLAGDGTMEVPPTGFPAGWYTGAPTPGELGPAVIAGHVDWQGPGVFHDLFALEIGDEVLVTRADGSTATFRVTRVAQFPKDGFPTEEVYGDIDHAGLRLITCGGLFNRATRSHDDNIVVFAALT